MATTVKIKGVAGTAPSCLVWRKDPDGKEANLSDGHKAVDFDELREYVSEGVGDLNPEFADFILNEMTVDPIAALINTVYGLASDVEAGEMFGENPADILRTTARNLLLAADAR
jgi:hypothetical protein